MSLLYLKEQQKVLERKLRPFKQVLVNAIHLMILCYSFQYTDSSMYITQTTFIKNVEMRIVHENMKPKSAQRLLLKIIQLFNITYPISKI